MLRLKRSLPLPLQLLANFADIITMKYLLSLFLFSLSLDAFANPPPQLQALTNCEEVADTPLIQEIDRIEFTLNQEKNSILQELNNFVPSGPERLVSGCRELGAKISAHTEKLRELDPKLDRAIEGLNKLEYFNCRRELLGDKRTLTNNATQLERRLRSACSATDTIGT
jgi:hypothetical protein